MSNPDDPAIYPHDPRPSAVPVLPCAACLTVKEAAARLGVSAQLVYALCAGGKIVHERHGLGRGTIRITAEALEQYRRGARVEHGTATPAPLKHLSPPPPRPARRPRGPS